MDEKMQERILAKMERFLETQREVWYPQLPIIYKKKSAYASFDDFLKREILYAGYVAEELLSGVEVKMASDRNRLDASFSYKSEDKGTPLPKGNILEAMNSKGFLSDLRFSVEEDMGKPNFQGSVQFKGGTYEVMGHLAENKLCWLSIGEPGTTTEQNSTMNRDKGEKSMFESEAELKDWLVSILRQWLKEVESLDFEWSSQSETDQKKGTFLLRTLVELADIGIDASSEEEPQVFRWKEERLASLCKSHSLLPRKDVEDIIAISNLKIPKNAELAGLSSYGENTPSPSLMARYIHLVPDEDFSKETQAEAPSEITSVYRNPGKIVVEGDFCIFYIDPENRRVISEFRKWRPVKNEA